MSPIELSILISRVESICAEMGAVLQHAAFSPNIKDRLDFSCALFDAAGELYAQAATIGVDIFIDKPFNSQTIEHAIVRLLEDGANQAS